MLNRNPARYGFPCQRFSSLHDFFTSNFSGGVAGINYGGGFLDFVYINKNSKTTIVIFHAALSSTVSALPIFSGLKVTSLLDANVLAISDPSLLLDLELAWFAGNDNQNLQRDLPVIISWFVRHFDVSNLIFFGASGGGLLRFFTLGFFRNRYLFQ